MNEKKNMLFAFLVEEQKKEEKNVRKSGAKLIKEIKPINNAPKNIQ